MIIIHTIGFDIPALASSKLSLKFSKKNQNNKFKPNLKSKKNIYTFTNY
jgi:hypothetical protein